MAALLLDTATLAVWVQQPEAEVEADSFATALIEAVSTRVCDTAGHGEDSATPWDATSAPEGAKLIAIQVARRTYLNPEAETAYGLAGGPSGSNAQWWASALNFLPEEIDELEKLGGLTTRTRRRGDLWIQGTAADTSPAPSILSYPVLFSNGSAPGSQSAAYLDTHYDAYAAPVDEV